MLVLLLHLKLQKLWPKCMISAELGWKRGSSHCGSALTNPTSIHEDAGLIPGLTHWVKDLALL